MKITLLAAVLSGFVLSAAGVFADDIKVSVAFDGSGGRQLISMSPNGGLGASKTQQVTGREVFIMQNLTGDKIQDGAQVKFRMNDTIWNRSGNVINRVSARGSKDDTTVFDLKDVGGQFRLMVPGGGWLGGVAEGGRSFSIVENEEDGILVEFIVNPLGEEGQTASGKK